MIKLYSIFQIPLSSARWDDIGNDNDVHHSYRMFVNVFSETFNSSFPVRPGYLPQKRKRKPWMTKALVNACKKRIHYRPLHTFPDFNI